MYVHLLGCVCALGVCASVRSVCEARDPKRGRPALDVCAHIHRSGGTLILRAYLS